MVDTTPDIKKGLAGVIVDTTAVSMVNPETNTLLYRGYPVGELADTTSVEEVALLLWSGELPTEVERDAFLARSRRLRSLSPELRELMAMLPTTSHPMDVVRTVISAIGAMDPDWSDASPAANLAKSEKLFAVLPAIVAFDQRRRRGQGLIEPRDDLGYSDNFLWMTFGEEPNVAMSRAFSISMVLYAEHSFNASTFAARVITSTLSDLYSAVTGAIGALKGPLHGGANEAVMDMLDEISALPATADRAADWLDDALAAKKKIMGFGHRVYRKGDSRVPTMHREMVSLAHSLGRDDLLELYESLETAMTARKGILPNLDYPSGPAYHMMGFDTPTFTPLFVASRITGWTAHIMEQVASNALIRPLSLYNGADERHIMT
jgi:citrate synthase